MTAEKTATATDHRGLGHRIKGFIYKSRLKWGEDLFRLITRIFNGVIGLLPYALKYGVGTLLRRNKYPYSLLQKDDFVIQMGAQRDTLAAGRSRAIHFARIVRDGTVVVIEPDPSNCSEFKPFIENNGLARRVKLVEMGAWNASGELKFLSSDSHPAANVLASAKDIGEETMKKRGYREITVPVDTLDNILRKNGIQGTPKLVSITTNGAERQILEGMAAWLGTHEVPYISLALTGQGYPDLMSAMGYDMIAFDDRGYTFSRRA